MALKPARAAVKAYTHMKPDVVDGYKAIRAMEEISSRLEAPRIRVREGRVKVPAPDGHEIECRTFTPLGLAVSLDGVKFAEDWRGTIVFFHGGGWVTGQVDLYADACKDLALALKRRIVSVDYRLAPESRFPTPLDDCYAVTKAVMAGEVFDDVVPDHVILMGDSAGGNLACAVALKARDTGDFKVPRAILLYPVLNNDYGPDSPYPSVAENGTDYVLTAQDCQEYLMLYSRGPADLENPYLAPLLTQDYENLPDALVVSAELCPLRDEDEEFYQRLKKAGNETACFRMLGAMHGYLLYPTAADTVRTTYAICKSYLGEGELPKGNGTTWLEIPGIA